MKRAVLKYFSHWSSCDYSTYWIRNFSRAWLCDTHSTWPGIYTILSLDYMVEERKKERKEREKTQVCKNEQPSFHTVAARDVQVPETFEKGYIKEK